MEAIKLIRDRDWRGLPAYAEKTGNKLVGLNALILTLALLPERAQGLLYDYTSTGYLTGNYENYKGLNRVKVLYKNGLLHLEQKNPLTDTCVPMIPEDDFLESNRYYIWSEGIKQPIEFVVQSSGKIDLYVERYIYHKTTN